MSEEKCVVKSCMTGDTIVMLTPDDILTLRLLREFLNLKTLGNWKTNEWDKVLDTLNRILKQVG